MLPSDISSLSVQFCCSSQSILGFVIFFYPKLSVLGHKPRQASHSMALVWSFGIKRTFRVTGKCGVSKNVRLSWIPARVPMKFLEVSVETGLQFGNRAECSPSHSWRHTSHTSQFAFATWPSSRLGHRAGSCAPATVSSQHDLLHLQSAQSSDRVRRSKQKCEAHSRCFC